MRSMQSAVASLSVDHVLLPERVTDEQPMHHITLQVFCLPIGRKDLAYRHRSHGMWHSSHCVRYRAIPVLVMPLFCFLHQTSREWRWQWKTIPTDPMADPLRHKGLQRSQTTRG